MNLLFRALLIIVAGSQSVTADIILTLSQSGSGVTARWSGAGTVNTGGGQNPGGVLNFNNFSGNPFAVTGTFTLDLGISEQG